MMEHPPHFLFTEPYSQQAVARVEQVGSATVLDACDEVHLVEAVPLADALLVRTATRVTKRVLDHASRLRVIGRGGAGVDNIDLAAARARGVVVVHTPDAATDAVADLTVGLMLSLIRNLYAGDRAVRSGRFVEGRAGHLGRELGSLTLGVIGMGRAGRAVARRCALGFGMPIVYNDIVDVEALEVSAPSVSKAALYQRADIVTLHVPLTDTTRGLINDEALSLFKSGSYLINASRGAVIDASAVARALSEGRLAGAAIDVFDPEPPPPDHPLLTAPNTLLTPHIGARTHNAQQRMNAVVEDVIGVLNGQPPKHPAC